MLPLSVGIMDVNNSSKITRKRCELHDWGIESMFGVVYLSVQLCVIYPGYEFTGPCKYQITPNYTRLILKSW